MRAQVADVDVAVGHAAAQARGLDRAPPKRARSFSGCGDHGRAPGTATLASAT